LKKVEMERTSEQDRARADGEEENRGGKMKEEKKRRLTEFLISAPSAPLSFIFLKSFCRSSDSVISEVNSLDSLIISHPSSVHY
jgi:hypothetical protein